LFEAVGGGFIDAVVEVAVDVEYGSGALVAEAIRELNERITEMIQLRDEPLEIEDSVPLPWATATASARS
jgi:hypothetical protein